MMSSLDFFQSQPDYENFSPYLAVDDDEVPQFIEPPFKPNYDTAIVVDGTPVTTRDKIQKLNGALLQVFNQLHASLTVDDIYLPTDALGSTCGFCFINFPNRLSDEAMASAQGFALGKNVFRFSRYSDLDKYASLPLEFLPSAPPEFKPRPDPTDWLCDPLGRDQFVIRHAKETEVFWSNMSNEDPVHVYGGERVRLIVLFCLSLVLPV